MPKYEEWQFAHEHPDCLILFRLVPVRWRNTGFANAMRALEEADDGANGIDWHADSHHGVYMVSCTINYGYPDFLNTRLAGKGDSWAAAVSDLKRKARVIMVAIGV